MDLRRSQSESPLDYHKRLVYGKLIDKTLSDVDYSELSEFVYGQTYSSDVARRMMYGSRKTLELLDEMRIDGSEDYDILSEIESKTLMLQKERQKFYDQRREFTKLVSAEGRKEYIYETLANAADKLNEELGLIYSGDVSNVSWNDNEAVLVLSDWHYGLNASNIFNTYNTEVCKQRVKDIVESTIERIQLHGCSKLHIVILGDLIHGAIKTSVRVASEELVCDQLMQVSEILAQSVCRLSECVDETNVYMTYGNHARTVANKMDSIHRDNMERIIPWWLSQRLKEYSNINIVNDFDTEFLMFDVCGHSFCGSHGDLDSVKTSPRLLFTLFNKKYGKDLEYILLGDKHHRESFEELGVTSILCGSLCGSDDYANDKRLYSTPSQMLLIINKDSGLDAEYRLKCK